MRVAAVPCLLLIAVSTAAAQTTAPAKPLLSSDFLTLSDYCTVILAPKVQDALAANDTQREAFAKERDRFELMVANVAEHTGGRGTTMLLGAARRALEIEGQRVRDLLTVPQDTAFQKLFEDKSLAPIGVRVASTAARPGMSRSTFGSIELVYTHYKEAGAAGAATAPALAAAGAVPGAAAKPTVMTTPAAAPPAGPAAVFDAHAKPLDAAFAAAIKPVLEKKSYELSRVRNGAFATQAYVDVPATPGILVGLRCSLGMQDKAVVAVQPIFLTATGEVLGTVHGTPTDHTIDLVARPGYAVGAVKAAGGGGLDSLSLSFMRLKGAGLDPTDTYDSEKLGGPGGGGPVTMGGDGTPIIGIAGREQPSGPYLALGIVSFPESAAAAKTK